MGFVVLVPLSVLLLVMLVAGAGKSAGAAADSARTEIQKASTEQSRGEAEHDLESALQADGYDPAVVFAIRNVKEMRREAKAGTRSPDDAVKAFVMALGVDLTHEILYAEIAHSQPGWPIERVGLKIPLNDITGLESSAVSPPEGTEPAAVIRVNNDEFPELVVQLASQGDVDARRAFATLREALFDGERPECVRLSEHAAVQPPEWIKTCVRCHAPLAPMAGRCRNCGASQPAAAAEEA